MKQKRNRALVEKEAEHCLEMRQNITWKKKSQTENGAEYRLEMEQNIVWKKKIHSTLPRQTPSSARPGRKCI